jgi:hypothetical protein
MSSIPETAAGFVPAQPRYARLPDGTQVEPIAHPLFSSYLVPAGNIPSEMVFFSYGVGDQLPGASAGTLARNYHTNMDRGGQLAAPRHQLITGVRVYISPLQWSSAAAPSMALPTGFSANTPENSTDFNDVTGTPANAFLQENAVRDIQMLLNACVLTVEHQGKLIVEQPLWTVPGNYGAAGIATLESEVGLPTAVTYRNSVVSIPTSTGLPQTFGSKSFMLRPTESIEVKIVNGFASGGGNSVIQGKLLTVILDGTQLRARR